jgi:predicted nucleic acid-binding Zn ribbon protein
MSNHNQCDLCGKTIGIEKLRCFDCCKLESD